MLGMPLTPQGEKVAGVLEARRGEGVRYGEVAVQMPRRSAKSTSIWSVLIGRAMERPGWRCVTTAQSGTVASAILLEHGNLLEARGWGGFDPRRPGGHNEELGNGTLRLLRNGGREKIEFQNGSRIWCVPPEAAAVRSAAADCIVVDEAGEHEGDKGVLFLDGVRPLMDTRGPLAQLIIAGTPGKARAGMFWDALTAARAGTDRDLGIVDYSALDDEDPEDRKVWRRVHPGPASGLTPMRVIEKRRTQMGIVQFAREYLCLWPSDAMTGALDVEAFRACEAPLPESWPDRTVVAFDCAKDGTISSVLRVWRDESGRACMEVMAHRPGTSWVARYVHEAARRLRADVVLDEIGGNVEVAADVRRMRPGVRLVPIKMLHVGGAAQRLATAIRERKVLQFGQPDLIGAVEACSWRPLGRDGRAFGQRPGMAPIAPAVAASLGLWHFDAQPDRERVRIVTSAR